MPVTPSLVLASTSSYRRELLARLDLPFELAAPDFDERAHEPRFAALDDGEYALELARGKAHSVVARYGEGAWILAADQIAVLPGPPRELLHKPGSAERAIEQLMELRGLTHVLTTAVVLLAAGTGVMHEAVDRQRLTMRAYERDEAEAYVAAHSPLDTVGSYRVEDAGVRLIARIEGDDITGVVGLPLLTVCALLRRAFLLPA
jgi:septum formation protein